MSEDDPTAHRGGPGRRARVVSCLPGLALTTVLAAVASVLGASVPIIGAPVFGLVLGVAVGILMRAGSPLEAGCAVSGSLLLQASIVVLGTGLSLRQVLAVGTASLPVMLGTLAVALAGAWLVGGALRVDRETRLLIGVGTGVCGASAIAAVTAAIDAEKSRVAQAIGTIFTFNLAAVLVFPSLGHLLGLSQEAFGLWAGTAVNDTSSVVATAYAYGPEAGERGVVVKLTRALMIIPISLALVLWAARRRSGRGPAARAEPAGVLRWLRLLPLFIVGFLTTSMLETLGAIPATWHPFLDSSGVFLMTMALAGIGASTRIAALRRAGWAPLLLGGILFVLVGASSIGLQWATGTL